MNFVTTIYNNYGTKMRVALCLRHRNNRIGAGDVYGKMTLKSDGRHTPQPCYDCRRPCQCMTEPDGHGNKRVAIHSSQCSEYLSETASSR